MADNKTDHELLEDIRNLLRPMSAIAQPQYEELMRGKKKEQIGEIHSAVGRSEKKAAAARLMDGTRTRKEIAKAASIDSGDLSRLITTLKEGGLVEEAASRPKLAVEASVVWSE